MDHDGVGARLTSTPKVEDGCKSELPVFAVVQQTNLPASHQGRNGVKFGINRLPPNLTHIGDDAFESCSGLTAIALPPGLTHIGDGAFESCSGLTAIALPPGLTHIGDNTFASCSGLTEIALPPGLTHIGKNAFHSCSGLTVIALPPGLTHIGVGAFYSPVLDLGRAGHVCANAVVVHDG